MHSHLPGGTSDIILSVLHVSSMFSTSSSFLELHLTSFHQASLGFLLRTSSDWSKGFSSCYHSKMGKHIAKSSSLTDVFSQQHDNELFLLPKKIDAPSDNLSHQESQACEKLGQGGTSLIHVTNLSHIFALPNSWHNTTVKT